MSALSVAEIGSFFAGGPVHFVDPNGELMATQMYAQYVRLTKPNAAAPLLMRHGGGMTGGSGPK
jgi:hypothetical protein